MTRASTTHLPVIGKQARTAITRGTPLAWELME